MTRDAVRLQGRLAGNKRKRNEHGADVVPFTNGVASTPGDNDDSDEESRVKAVSKKEKPKSAFDKFPVPLSNKKKQSQAVPLANGAAAAPKPTRPLPTPDEPALSKARSPGATPNGVPTVFPTASSFSNGTPAPHRTPSPARSTSNSFGGSRSPRSIAKAARRLLKRKAIFRRGRLEIVDVATPAWRTGPSGVPAADPPPPPPPPPTHQVKKGKGKEKETGTYADSHVPLINLGRGMPRAKGKPHTLAPREENPVVSPTTSHPSRIRQSLPNGSTVSGKSVPFGPITPIIEPNQEPPEKRKRRRKRKRKEHQQAAGDANSEQGPKSVSGSIDNLSDEEE